MLKNRNRGCSLFNVYSVQFAYLYTGLVLPLCSEQMLIDGHPFGSSFFLLLRFPLPIFIRLVSFMFFPDYIVHAKLNSSGRSRTYLFEWRSISFYYLPANLFFNSNKVSSKLTLKPLVFQPSKPEVDIAERLSFQTRSVFEIVCSQRRKKNTVDLFPHVNLLLIFSKSNNNNNNVSVSITIYMCYCPN